MKGGYIMGATVQISEKFVEVYEQTLLSMVKEVMNKANSMDRYKPYMNKKEAALYIGVSFNTLQKFIDKGMPVIEVDGVKLISKRDIDEFLEKKKQ